MSQVYFAEVGGRIKIGMTSKSVTARLAQISAHLPSPLVLIGHIDGGLPLERAIQRHLHPFSLKGEWFRDSEQVRSVIRSLILRGPSALGVVDYSLETKVVRIAPTPNRRGLTGAQWCRIATLIWPDRVLSEFAAFAEQPEHIVKTWLDDTAEMPRLIRGAMAARLLQWVGDDTAPLIGGATP